MTERGSALARRRAAGRLHAEREGTVEGAAEDAAWEAAKENGGEKAADDTEGNEMAEGGAEDAEGNKTAEDRPKRRSACAAKCWAIGEARESSPNGRRRLRV